MGNPFPQCFMVKPFPHPEYVFYTALQSGILTNKPLFFIDNFKWLSVLFLKKGLYLIDSIYKLYDFVNLIYILYYISLFIAIYLIFCDI